jgi:hypothetical protein
MSDTKFDVVVAAYLIPYEGGEARSLLSLLRYLRSGDYRERYLGVKIPPTHLQDYHLDAARKFAEAGRPSSGGHHRRLSGRASG